MLNSLSASGRGIDALTLPRPAVGGWKLRPESTSNNRCGAERRFRRLFDYGYRAGGRDLGPCIRGRRSSTLEAIMQIRGMSGGTPFSPAARRTGAIKFA